MIIERSFPLLKLAATVGAAAGVVWLIKKLRAQKPKPVVVEARTLRAGTRVGCEVPWGETV
jgi:hypothetical protein